MTQEPLTKLNPHSVVVHHSIILLSIMEIIPLFMDLTKYISSLKLFGKLGIENFKFRNYKKKNKNLNLSNLKNSIFLRLLILRKCLFKE